jgi:ankyrin repeat protein
VNVVRDPFTAVQSGDLNALREMLHGEPGLAVARDGQGLSILLFAAYRGNQEAVNLLIAADQPLDIFEATIAGRDARVAELLAQDPALARAWSSDGFTALHYAAFFGQPEAARRLLAHGAGVNERSRNGFNVMPLHSAVAGQHIAVSELLVSHGADVNERQEAGFTPLHAAAQHGDRAHIDLLLAHGADRTARLENGQTAAEVATANGHPELADLLAGER